MTSLNADRPRVGCVLMASGKSVRFGSNKLLAEFQGKTLLQRALDLTDGLFHRRVVVTRTEEAAELCRSQKVDVILHSLPHRNDTVQLGTERLGALDALVFCPCDQPLLRRESLSRLLDGNLTKDTIRRLACRDSIGTPILFGSAHFPALCALPEKAGGSYLAKKYPEKVELVFTEDPQELMDVDTPDDLARLLATT